jgi:hypothetical protein
MNYFSEKKIGIFLDAKKNSGGVFQELSLFIKNFHRFNKNHNLKFEIISNIKDTKLHQDLKNIKINYFKLGIIQKVLIHLINYNIFFHKINKFFKFKNKFEEYLKKNNFDFIIFTSTSQYSLYLTKTNYCLWVQDVDHRDYLEFPEVGNLGLFLWKERIYEKAIKRASIIITGCEIIKKRIISLYNCLENRILVINQEPSLSVQNFNKTKNTEENINFLKKYKLPKKYIFYPAMYFPHKNHKLIIDSLKIINSKNKEDVSAIFCGFDKGYLQNLKEYSKIINVDDKVTFLEFIDDEEIPFFYINSIALVMPTLMGPNNIPPWEAFKLRVPVFYSRFGNIETVLKNAVSYIDQFDPKDLADGIINLMHDEKIRDNLIKSGENLLNSIDKKKDYESLLDLIVKNRTIKERWNLF